MTIQVLDDGELRDATEEEIAEIEARSIGALETLKTTKNAEINRWRAEANLSFLHAGKLVSCDSLSRSDIDGVANNIALFGVFPGGFQGAWKAVDNTLIPMPNIDAFKALYASMTEQGAVNFNHSQDLKAALAAAATADEVDAIAWCETGF